MENYDVNVRAIVSAAQIDTNAVAEINGWEIYDYEAIESNADGQQTSVEIRCDQTVSVEAFNEEEAVEKAKNEATDIIIDGFLINNITLWTDNGIDITVSDKTDFRP